MQTLDLSKIGCLRIPSLTVCSILSLEIWPKRSWHNAYEHSFTYIVSNLKLNENLIFLDNHHSNIHDQQHAN